MLLGDHVFTRGVRPGSRPVFHHVLLTRLAMDAFRERVNTEATADFERWLRARMPIFQGVCQASVLAQRRRPRRWILAADQQHEELVRELLGAELVGTSWVRLAWQLHPGGVAEPARDVFSRTVLQTAPDAYDYLMSSRVDNDDALNSNYVRWAEQYAAAVVEQQPQIEDFWLSFPVGAQHHDGRYFQYHHTCGHFLTRVVRRDRFEAAPLSTTMAIPHTTVFDQGTPVYTPLTRQPMWLQNVHGANVSNSAVEGLLELGPADQVAQMFGLDVTGQAPGPAEGVRVGGRSVAAADVA